MIGVIADDLTGCGDIGVFFAASGLRTVIRINPTLEKYEIKRATEVLIVNTESRSDSAETAYGKVKSACNLFGGINVYRVYKKIDSALRGNIGSEIDGFFDGSGIKFLPFCAAFPAMGRVTRDGYHYVNGKLVTESEFAKDLRNPVKEAHIPTLLKKQSVHHEKVRVYDCATGEDLKDIARETASLPAVCGAAGLAEELVKLWVDNIKFCPEKEPAEKGPVLVISGSASPVTHAQIEELTRSMDILDVPLDFNKKRADIMGEKSWPSMVIYPAKGLEGVKSGVIMNTLARLVSKLCGNGMFRNLVIAGGDTAFNVCGALGLETLAVKEAVLPGVAICKGIEKEYNVILKPGSFGDKNALLECCKVFM